MHKFSPEKFPRGRRHGGRATRREVRREGTQARLADTVIHQLNLGAQHCAPYIRRRTATIPTKTSSDVPPPLSPSARFPTTGGKKKTSDLQPV
ncbi:hypothetical protein JTE90_024458 [Oedothorax gibbosus]|uniref:Uncharacterized protein n=1 Tax=Oedothorax gibbosus TaxID=931172 RepID=A0AAV6TK33_9ARAC|nr:hypothetical protein JTE90_024458 [Oedothorax gibbosus]